MSNEEHYFENLIFHKKDIKGEPNKNALSPEVQEAIEICADYVSYTLFNGRKHLHEFLNDEGVGEWFDE